LESITYRIEAIAHGLDLTHGLGPDRGADRPRLDERDAHSAAGAAWRQRFLGEEDGSDHVW
jgi:hypothetical protein